MDLSEKATVVFGAVPRPEHFTDFQHCCECAEYDEILQRHDPGNIRFDQLGPAADPMCFVTDQAFRYYFPGLARLALEGAGDTYCVGQLLFHLISDGLRNNRWKSFTPRQRRYVVELLEHFVETRPEEIDRCGDTDRIFRAIEIWSDQCRDLGSVDGTDA